MIDSERQKELMERIASVDARPKFPAPIARILTDRAATEEKLLLCYGACVAEAGGAFRMDAATLSKVEKVTRWMYDSPKAGLILTGSLGNGKTTMLLALRRMFGIHVRMMDSMSVFDRHKDEGKMPQYEADRLYLLDDLGSEPVSYNGFGEVRYPMVELLLAMYRRRVPAVISTNLSFEQIAKSYGDRVADRLSETYAVINYTEESYRRRGNKTTDPMK